MRLTVLKYYGIYVFAMSLPEISLGVWFCMSRKSRTERGEFVLPKVNSTAMSELGCENPSVGPFSLSLSTDGPRKQSSYLVEPPCIVQGQSLLALPEQHDVKTLWDD